MRTCTAQARQQINSSYVALITVLQAVGVAGAFVLAAKLRIFLPWSPVPITLQTLVMLVAGAALPMASSVGGAAMYIAAATAGLPVIAGPSVFGPTGGYLLGFVAATALLASRSYSTPVSLLGCMAVAELVLYALGVPWLAAYTGCSLAWALRAGMIPFLVGDVIKLLAAWAVVCAWKSGRTPCGR
jgi:biotin transport system substrate-specific component